MPGDQMTDGLLATDQSSWSVTTTAEVEMDWYGRRTVSIQTTPARQGAIWEPQNSAIEDVLRLWLVLSLPIDLLRSPNVPTANARILRTAPLDRAILSTEAAMVRDLELRQRRYARPDPRLPNRHTEIRASLDRLRNLVTGESITAAQLADLLEVHRLCSSAAWRHSLWHRAQSEWQTLLVHGTILEPELPDDGPFDEAASALGQAMRVPTFGSPPSNWVTLAVALGGANLAQIEWFSGEWYLVVLGATGVNMAIGILEGKYERGPLFAVSDHLQKKIARWLAKEDPERRQPRHLTKTTRRTLEFAALPVQGRRSPRR